MNNREQVIANIRAAVADGDFHRKVETDDPVLTAEESRQLLYRFLKDKQSPRYGVRNFIAQRLADMTTWYINRHTRIVGLENLHEVRHGGAIVTSNHFSPFDNTVIRHLLAHEHKGQLVAVSQDTNSRMRGLRGFLLRYIDAIPLSRDPRYMATFFVEQLREAVQQGRWVLMYPEQEMWYHYRKPRPCRRGAYFYAHKTEVPVVSCFVQIDTPRPGELHYTLYVLPPVFPDYTLSCKADSERMAAIDYQQKRHAYEQAYHRSLDYTFSAWDIAGWQPSL